MKKTDLERLTELAQACVARTPVIVLGSGASLAHAARVGRSDPGDRRSGRLPSRFICTDQSGQFDDERPSDVT